MKENLLRILRDVLRKFPKIFSLSGDEIEEARNIF